MACERYREALTELAAGAPASAGLDAHLVGCEGCRQELATLRRALAAVDADLRQLVASEPSPALAARIRQAAAEPEAEFGWRPAFSLQALAVATVLAAALALVLRAHAPAPTPAAAITPPPLASGTPQSALTALAAAPIPQAAPPRPPAEARVLPRVPAHRAVPPEPEVLVPTGEGEALRRLVALVNRQRVAPPSMGAAGQTSPDLGEPRPIEVRSIDIKPLEIVPLDSAETSGT